MKPLQYKAAEPASFFIKAIRLVPGLLVFILIFYRAAHLSMTFDESATTDLLQASYWDTLFADRFFQSANNHILNSLLMKGSVAMFGEYEWAIRLPNVLSFLLYYLAVVSLARQITSRWKEQLLIIVLFCCQPYLIDFFSLARGYGMAVALQTMSLALMHRGCNTSNKRLHYGSFILAILSAYANFTWILFYVALWGWYILYTALRMTEGPRKHLQFLKYHLVPLMLILFWGLLSFKPLSILMQQDEFRWGANAWIDSMHRFVKDFLFIQSRPIGMMAQGMLFLIVLFAIRYLYKTGIKTLMQSAPGLLFVQVCLLIGLLISITILQRFLLQSHYPDGRKALFYFPLVTLFVLLTLYHMSWPICIKKMLALGSCIFYFIHIVTAFDLHVTHEWWFDADTKKVTAYIASHPIEQKRATGVSWILASSMHYYNVHRFHAVLAPLTKMEDIKQVSSYAYYYVTGDDAHNVPQEYRPLARFGWDRFLFVKDSAAYLQERYRYELVHHLNGMEADSALKQQRLHLEWTTCWPKNPAELN